MSDRKIGWFGKVYKNVFNGEDLSNFCQERFGFS